jgi:hypothetical protein
MVTVNNNPIQLVEQNQNNQAQNQNTDATKTPKWILNPKTYVWEKAQ